MIISRINMVLVVLCSMVTGVYVFVGALFLASKIWPDKFTFNLTPRKKIVTP